MCARKVQINMQSNSPYSLHILLQSNTDKNHWMPVAAYGKDGKTFIYGKKDKVFRLRFSNSTASRVLAVPSIDGLSTINGQPCTAQSPGYVVSAYTSMEIIGWSMNSDESAKFVFKDKTGSYANNNGSEASTLECGSIGCLVFAEKPEPVQIPHTVFVTIPKPTPPPVYVPTIWPWSAPSWPQPYWSGTWYGQTTCSSPSIGCCGNMQLESSDEVCAGTYSRCAADSVNLSSLQDVEEPMSAAKSDAPEFSLGTGWGDAQPDRTHNVAFAPGELLETIVVYYTGFEELKAAGVEVDKKATAKIGRWPSAFSGMFCPPPIVGKK
jgi:hypothetical protein